MDRDAKCKHCGSSDLDDSDLESLGDVVCNDCGYVVENWKFVSAAAPIREGDDTRPGGPSRRQAPIPAPNTTLKDGDIVWNIPPRKKRGVCDEESGGCGNSQLIKELDDECKKCGSNTLWRYNFNPNSPPPTKDEEWIFKRQASQFLRLQEAPGKKLHGKEEHLSEDIKNLRIEGRWTDLVVDAISNPGLPERAPVGEDGERMWTPERERIGIEVYLLLTQQERCFWFFDDFIHRMRLNRNLIERILEKPLPISKNFGKFLPEISNRDFGLNNSHLGFIPRCCDILGVKVPLRNTMPLWFENPEKEWSKLALGVRDSESQFPLRFWEEVPEWNESDTDSGRIKGIVKEYSSPLILRHIPAAYYIAQEIWCRGDDNAREICTRILEMIAMDLRWCAATVEEMDDWWDSVWAQQFCESGDDTPSITKLRSQVTVE